MAFTFGASTATPANLGGQPATSQPVGGGGFTFGASAPAPAATSSAFNFGAPTASAAPAAGGFSFGAPAASTAPISGGFSFGAPAASNAPSTGGFTFGAPAASAAPATGGFSFSAPATSSAPNAGVFSFGAPATSTAPTTGFGMGTGGLFGQTKPATGFGFSNTTGGLFGATTAANAQANRDQQIWQLLVQADEASRKEQSESLLSTEGLYRPENIWQSLALLRSWWDPQSPFCRFKYYFYNKVSPQEVHLYQRPANQDPRAWAAAQKANPDPTCMVPTLAVGLEDLKKRIEEQDKTNEAHYQRLSEVDEKIKKMEQKILMDIATKLADSKKRHKEITQRVIKFLKFAQVLRHKGLSLTPDEDAMRTHYEHIQYELQNSEQFHGKLSQLWAQLQLIKESGRKYGKVDGVDAWDTVKESDMQAITKFLEEQHHGIEYTIETLQKDIKEVSKLEHPTRRL
ncbi:nucleoporin complex subunit 54-domain-containing protein [Phycomyces blakesleeanus]|uniref:Nucleoporin complex subunit 54-domain-containing protein n=1 Tax=Phycomyces blakesleeanus TaxID=4837 RepID=A0ABR3BBJ0_PHYBL